MQTAASLAEHERDSASGASAQWHPDATTQRRNHAVRFTEWDREDQRQALCGRSFLLLSWATVCVPLERARMQRTWR